MLFINTDIMIYALLGLLLIFAIWIIRLELRLGRLLAGKDGKTLEDTIRKLALDLKEIEKFRDDSIEYLKAIEYRLKRSTQAIETVRFNPFKGTGSGGNQSFSTAFLNERGDGIVLTTLYARDRVSVFSKPVKKFKSEIELTGEEKNAVEQARATLPLPTIQ
jgi:hypothetical protein